MLLSIELRQLVDDVELGLVKPITKPKSHQNGCADVETLAVSVSQARPFVLILIHLEFLPAAGEKLGADEVVPRACVHPDQEWTHRSGIETD